MTKTFKFIAIEGCDGTGKTTLAKRLRDRLSKKHGVILTNEPAGTPLGAMVKNVLKSNLTQEAELLLLSAARSQHVHHVILPALRAGKIVISDRFADSTRAYQGTNKFTEDLIRRTTYGVKPSLTIVIHGDERVIRERSVKLVPRFDSADLSRYRKVQSRFLQMAKKDPDHYLVVNGGKCSKDELLEEVEKRVEQWLIHISDQSSS